MKFKDSIVVTILTVISPLVHGYYFGFIDQDFYIPYVNKIINPDLYPNDYIFAQGHWQYSPFNYVVAFLVKPFGYDLAAVDLGLYLLTLWLLYFSVYSLAKTIYQKSSVGFLAVFFLIIPKWAAQIGHMTHQFYFVSRDLSMALSLLALNLILKRKFWFSLLLLFLAELTNLSIPIPVGLLWVWLWWKRRRE